MADPDMMKDVRRINFVGDSLTDGSAWTDWVIESLRANGYPNVVKQDAGVAGDNVAKLKARFTRDVLDRKPDLVILNIGTNDREPVAEYQREVGELVKQVRQTGAKMLLAIPPGILDPKDPTRDARIVAYGAALRELAKQYDCGLVDLHAAFAGGTRAASIAEANAVSDRRTPPAESAKILWGPDGIHHTKNGWRTLGRAVLEALGCPAPLIEKVSVEPGMLTEWYIAAATLWKAGQAYPPLPAIPAEADLLEAGWRKFDRVTEAAQTSWWQECWLQRGGVMPLGQTVVPAHPGTASTTTGAFALAFVNAARDQKATLHVGGSPGFAVWVNGQLVWQGKELRGYHSDTDRFEIQLRAGENRILVFSNWIVYVAVD